MSKVRVALAAFIIVLGGSLVLSGCGSEFVELPADASPTAPVRPVEAPAATEPSTTTTVDPAAVEAFLGAWEASQTTTTTAPPPPPTTKAPAPKPTAAPAPAPEPVYGSGCVIPSYICQRESHFNYGAVNPSSGAGGMYQFMPSTWNGIARQIAPEWVGTPPNQAPPEVQDQFAAYLWNGGAGCSHWSAC